MIQVDISGHPHVDSFQFNTFSVMGTFLCNYGFFTSEAVLKPYTTSRWITMATHLFQLAPFDIFSSARSFVIVGSICLGFSEALHIFQVDTGGLPTNPTRLFCMFSCRHIFLYFQGRFGALNNVFF